MRYISNAINQKDAGYVASFVDRSIYASEVSIVHLSNNGLNRQGSGSLAKGNLNLHLGPFLVEEERGWWMNCLS